MEKRLTESDSTSTDLGQALLDLQSQLEEVIQDFESETGEELSGEAEERRRVRITSLRESLKNDLDELQNQVALRVSQLEDRLSLLEIVIEGKNHFDSATVSEDEPSKKSSAKDTVFGETSSSQKPSERIEDKLLYCSFCGKSQHEVHKLIAGPSVFICNDCVELCDEIIVEEDQQEGLSKKPEKAPMRCSFCNKTDREVEHILTGPSVFICSECVAISNRIISEREKSDTSTDASKKLSTEVVSEADEAPDSQDVDFQKVENPASSLLGKVKRIFTSSQDSNEHGWPESSPSSKQQRQQRSGQMRFRVFVGYCCLGLLLGAASTVVMLYKYPDIWVIGLPKILFITVIALILLMVMMRRVRSDLPILVTLSVAILVGWYVTMFYLSSFAEFQFLRSVLSKNYDMTNFLILGGLACVGLSFISRKVFRVCSYLFAGLGAYIGFAIAGNV